MSIHKTPILPSAILCAVGCFCLVNPAFGQNESKFTARFGLTQIKPQVESGNLSAPSFAGTQADVMAATQISGGINYRIDQNLAIDVPIAPAFKHDIVGTGAIAGTGKIADTKALPITALLQYRFSQATVGFKPYLGVGLTYAYFYDTKTTSALTGLTGGTPSNPTTMSIASAWGSTFQAGAAYALSNNLGIDLSVTKTLLSTTATLSTGQGMAMSLNPWSYSVGLTYGF